MSDEEDFDEFPSITVNSSIHESSLFMMPSAEELSTQRAREAACERALRRLREEHAPEPQGVMLHSDSSGSEGEAAAHAALAAAVCTLHVAPPSPPAPAPAPAPLLRALLRHGGGGGGALLAACDAGSMPPLLMHQISASISEMVLEAAASEDVPVWSSEEILGVAGWLCAALAAPPPPPPRPRPGGQRHLLRTLHALIEDVATDAQMEGIEDLVLSCAAETAAALQLCDALRGAGGARGERLAAALARAALRHLHAPPHPQQEGAGAWRRLPPARQYLALQLAARLRARQEGGAGEGEGGAVLAALAGAPPGQRTHTTEQLKVLVAATKLQVLFHVNK